MRAKTWLLLIMLFIFSLYATAQDSTKVSKNDSSKAASVKDTSYIMNQLENEAAGDKTIYTKSTFKYTRVVDGHSVENLRAHVLDLRISHRFGPVSSGGYNFFGLDNATMRLGFDYGITNNFMVGIGHSTYQKTYDAFLKIKLLSQSTGRMKMPFTLSFVPTIAINSLKPGDYPVKLDSGVEAKSVSYVLQFLIARKFCDQFSLQLMPTYIHADNISFSHNKRDILAIGIAASEKISKHLNINGEYYYQLPDDQAPGSHNVLSFGIDIGTGGHVFQLHFTNSIGLTEKSFITETTGRWDKGDMLFGFNISRVFQLGKKHKENKDWNRNK